MMKNKRRMIARVSIGVGCILTLLAVITIMIFPDVKSTDVRGNPEKFCSVYVKTSGNIVTGIEMIQKKGEVYRKYEDVVKLEETYGKYLVTVRNTEKLGEIETHYVDTKVERILLPPSGIYVISIRCPDIHCFFARKEEKKGEQPIIYRPAGFKIYPEYQIFTINSEIISLDELISRKSLKPGQESIPTRLSEEL